MVEETRQNKKLRLTNSEEEDPDQINGDPSLENLQKIQEKLEKVEKEGIDKMLALELIYKEKWRSICDGRNKIIKSIPDFWLTTFLNHPVLGDLLNEDDKKIFKYLSYLDIVESKDVKSEYSIIFGFKMNPYFKDLKLIYTFLSSGGETTQITGTKIKWKKDIDVASGGDCEKKGGKRLVADKSFFTWFGETQGHDRVAEIIKKDLWPDPVKYFSNRVHNEDLTMASHEDIGNELSSVVSNMDMTHVFQTNQIFDSREHIIKWCQEKGKENNIVVIILKSQKQGKKPRLTLGCERGGVFRVHSKKTEQVKEKPEQGEKITRTKKCGCPFALKGVFLVGDKWKLEVLCGQHNHELETTLVGNSYVARLEEQERQLLIEMTKSGVRPRHMLTAIKERSQNNMSTLRTIYSERVRLRFAKIERRSSMQQVMKLLSEHHYVEWHRMDEEKKEVKDIFWAHPESLQLLKCFPSVLVVDGFKSKRYHMPWLSFVGVSSTGKTFTVAFAFLEAQTESDYSWALSCLKTILDPEEQPTVFVTDKEDALINGISEVFPEANRLLCTDDISRNILANCKERFETNEDLDTFLKEFREVTQSKTHIDFYDDFAAFERKYAKYPACLKYLQENWMGQKEHFVLSWTNLVKHFGNTTTKQARVAHSKLKQHIKSTKGDFTSCWMAMHNMIIGEIIAVKASFEKSLSASQRRYKIDAFNDLRGFVSNQSLDLLLIELSRVSEIDIDSSVCRCIMRTVYGLPCGHEMVRFAREGRPIPLSEIDPHWRKLTAITTPKPESNMVYLTEWDNFKKKWETSIEEERRSMCKKLKEIVSPMIMIEQQQPMVENNLMEGQISDFVTNTS